MRFVFSLCVSAPILFFFFGNSGKAEDLANLVSKVNCMHEVSA